MADRADKPQSCVSVCSARARLALVVDVVLLPAHSITEPKMLLAIAEMLPWVFDFASQRCYAHLLMDHEQWLLDTSTGTSLLVRTYVSVSAPHEF